MCKAESNESAHNLKDGKAGNRGSLSPCLVFYLVGYQGKPSPLIGRYKI